MNLETIEKILDTSSPEDWEYNDEYGIHTYKPDIELNIKIRPDLNSKLIDAIAIMLGKSGSELYDEIHGDTVFHEEWTQNYPDKKAYRLIVKIFYSGSFVKHYLFVYVDGCREIVPAPKPMTHMITQFQYNFGRILNRYDKQHYDIILQTAGFKVIE